LLQKREPQSGVTDHGYALVAFDEAAASNAMDTGPGCLKRLPEIVRIIEGVVDERFDGLADGGL